MLKLGYFYRYFPKIRCYLAESHLQHRLCYFLQYCMKSHITLLVWPKCLNFVFNTDVSDSRWYGNARPFNYFIATQNHDVGHWLTLIVFCYLWTFKFLLNFLSLFVWPYPALQCPNCQLRRFLPTKSNEWVESNFFPPHVVFCSLVYLCDAIVMTFNKPTTSNDWNLKYFFFFICTEQIKQNRFHNPHLF